jgi:hypothetical protein
MQIRGCKSSGISSTPVIPVEVAYEGQGACSVL